ncbi:hypothetical protein BSY239_3458 [Hydrogenophaga sp. RAC07]|nr:hypothetical protein BSY239_3458 [Hydrogenophaga sp. RAC07]
MFVRMAFTRWVIGFSHPTVFCIEVIEQVPFDQLKARSELVISRVHKCGHDLNKFTM